MRARVSDTHPKAERVQLDGLRALPVWRKLEIVGDLTMLARQLSLAGLRQRFPSATLEELHRRLATLCLGGELSTRAYGAEPTPPTRR